MLHQLILQVTALSSEAVLGLLLLTSVVSLAIIANRIWFFFEHRIDADAFARQLLLALDGDNWPKAQAVVRRSSASICLVIGAGLSQVDAGRSAVERAIRSATARERIRLEGPLGMLPALGYTALLLGVLGTLLDLIQLAQAAALEPAAGAIAQPTGGLGWLVALAPAAAGIFVAIPGLLAAAALHCRVRLVVRQIDSLAQIILLQVPSEPIELTTPQPAAARQAA